MRDVDAAARGQLGRERLDHTGVDDVVQLRAQLLGEVRIDHRQRHRPDALLLAAAEHGREGLLRLAGHRRPASWDAVAHGEPWEYLRRSRRRWWRGIGLAFASLANLIVEAVRPEQTGVATANEHGDAQPRRIHRQRTSAPACSRPPWSPTGSRPARLHAACLVAAAACGLAAFASLAVPRQRWWSGRSRRSPPSTPSRGLAVPGATARPFSGSGA